MTRFLRITATIAIAVMALAGCKRTVEQEFKDAMPDHEDLKVIMGQYDKAQSALPPDRYLDCPECCIDETDGGYIDSEIYKMTRTAVWHVNGSLVTIYLWLGLIVNSPYSETIENGYIWGPWDSTDIDPLSRLQQRFVMVEKDDDTFDYRLETKLINDDAGDWVAYVTGSVTPSEQPHKGVGHMAVDFDVLHQLDSAHPAQQHGRVVYDFDVRQVHPTKQEPNTVTVQFSDFWDDQEVDPKDPKPFQAEYYYERYENLAGKFQFVAWADFAGPDDAADQIEEEFNVESNWTEVGEGIGTASVIGGSLIDMDVQDYTLTECWADTEFLYYETYDHTRITYTNGEDPWEETGCGEIAHCPVID